MYRFEKSLRKVEVTSFTRFLTHVPLGQSSSSFRRYDTRCHTFVISSVVVIVSAVFLFNVLARSSNLIFQCSINATIFIAFSASSASYRSSFSASFRWFYVMSNLIKSTSQLDASLDLQTDYSEATRSEAKSKRRNQSQ